MTEFRFAFADKSRMGEILPSLFDLLYENMHKIAPTGNSREQDEAEWMGNLLPAMEKDPRQILLLYAGETFAGYFQYFVNNGLFMMEEIQFTPAWWGSGLFRAMYTWLLPRLPGDIRRVEAYADKRNTRSRQILGHLGLVPCGENPSGTCLHFAGDYADLKKMFI